MTKETEAGIVTEKLHAYLTWSLGIDMAGVAVVYARDKAHAMELLENYTAKAQPKHKLYPTYMPLEVRERGQDNEHRVHLYSIGVVETSPKITVIDRGEDFRFDD